MRRRLGLAVIVGLAVVGAAWRAWELPVDAPSVAGDASAARVGATAPPSPGPLAASVPASTDWRVRLAVESSLRVGEQALDGRVVLDADLRLTQEGPGVFRAGFSAVRAASAAVMGVPFSGQLTHAVARLTLGSDGALVGLSVSKGASPLFTHLMGMLARETFPPTGGGRTRQEVSAVGEAQAVYRFGPAGFTRARRYKAPGTAAATLTLACPPGVDPGALICVERFHATERLDDGRGFSASLDAERVRIGTTEVAVMSLATPTAVAPPAAPATPMPALTQTALLGTLAAPPAPGAERARFAWDATRTLALDPAAVRATEAQLRRSRGPDRDLGLDLLAQAGTPAAQAAFGRLVEDAVHEERPEAAAELQRSVLIPAPTAETRAALDRWWTNGPSRDVRLAAAHALGAASAGDEAVAKRLADAARGSDRPALLGALGNTDTTTAAAVLQAALAEGGEAAVSAARGLRHHPVALPALVARLAGELALARAALDALTTLARSSPEVVPSVAAAGVAGAINPKLAGQLLTFFQRHLAGPNRPALVAAAAVIAELPGVDPVTRGRMRDFVILAGAPS